jgi:hypothetical protein
MGNANRTALSVFMDGLMDAQMQREHPAPPYSPSDIPDLVTDEEPEATPLPKRGSAAALEPGWSRHAQKWHRASTKGKEGGTTKEPMEWVVCIHTQMESM